jgi:hypothetical protein
MFGLYKIDLDFLVQQCVRNNFSLNCQGGQSFGNRRSQHLLNLCWCREDCDSTEGKLKRGEGKGGGGGNLSTNLRTTFGTSLHQEVKGIRNIHQT